ncbi:MAG: lactate racemase domain-containing protein [Candidatus Bathyarchaeota archaeon]|nr:lactate racemase domain-containing protein [Candidatus Bathyarchaeota archaeon]
MTKVDIPHHCWYEDKPLTLTFPDEWKVHRCKVASEDAKAMTPEEIKAAIHNPIGQKPLTKLAENAEEVVIIFDDMTRPTKTWQYTPAILETLHKAGIPKDNIRFIIAPGTHGTYGRMDFAKKLGDDIVSEYQVYNHNPYEMLDYLGDTSQGCPVWVNSEVMACDLKIGIGTVLFHRLTGLSGGGKMISPGVVGIETIKYNHGDIGGFGPGLKPHESTGYLCNEGNLMRKDIEEAARMAGLDYKIDTVLNLDRDPIELYAGDFIETQRKAGEGVLRWHATESPEADIVVAGAYMRENEPYLSMWPCYNSVTEDGTIVMVHNDPDGDINHWLFNRHGKEIGASLWNPAKRRLAKGKRMIIFGDYPLKSFEMRYSPEEVTWIRRWDEVIEELKKHHGAGSRVAVIPDGTSCIPQKGIGG